ncbi:MAG: aldehyde dehydrogenase family protein [Paludisphaera borealis]|uniref:aldehyde dehydrogenase family protein n=1 Tax=Paludisphaera borealis TaxID=1387353 RepID=UPI002843419C|nr:aldehyde dehydrogenase family protein [Paludisphaera borealis]MDR3621185.1 aldehyde dehydrogenase family protein [Paludisphaera borealis]
MSVTIDDVLATRNPASGGEVGRVAATSPDAVAAIIGCARDAQAGWAVRPWNERRAVLADWWRILGRDARAWSDLIRDEIGKPATEAMAGDVIPTLDALRWTVKRSGKLLADERIGPSWQRWLLTPTGRLRWTPYGVVGIVGTWNYPLFLNAAPIAQALAGGNAVVWKPSELAIACGEKLQRSLEEAGTPPGLVAAVFGRGEVGQALLESNIDKAMFTGGVETGRRVLSTLAGRGIPAVVELSGFDPAIILPDAPVESTVRAIVWSAFVGCGQTCVAVKRIIVVGDARPWAEAFAAEIRKLRVGDPAEPGVDVGPMINDPARDRFDRTIRATVEAGAEVLAGGEPLDRPGSFYPPTLLSARSPEPERALEGAFGPVVLIRGVDDAEAAIAAANSSSMALAASVWGRDRRAARAIARRIEAGMVCVNEAVAPTASASAPFGGFKSSGYGRTHGELGLREFVAPQVLFERSAGGFRPQLFPYSRGGTVDKFLGFYRWMFHRRA